MDPTLPLTLLDLDPTGTEVSGPPDLLPSRYPVTQLLTAAETAAGLAYAAWATAQGLPRPEVAIDTRAVAAAGRSEALGRWEGSGGSLWAELSGWARACDGWVRLHANYDHHRAALCTVLGIRPERAALEAAVAHWSAAELESALLDAGGAGVAVRTPSQWAATPQADAIAAGPLIELGLRGPGPSELRPPRVLDLTRVIAGPVGTRMLGLLGADVLRLDRPDRTELDYYADTGLAKRSALVDLRAHDVEPLVAGADVVVLGYRPDALGPLRDVLERHPQLVVVELSAWGWTGPWGSRRGFDSLVQAATGIAVVEGSPDEPGALPCQALDHATGYLVAACAWHGLAQRARDGAGRHYRLALTQTARWLGAPWEAPCAGGDLQPVRQTLTGGYGRTQVVAPPLRLDGVVPRWPLAAQRPGQSAPRWR
jgi:hypothetical protein